jgi:hypothetical protein
MIAFGEGLQGRSEGPLRQVHNINGFVNADASVSGTHSEL